MKKWEEKNRAKAHQKRIQSAKSTISKTNTGGQSVTNLKSPSIGTNYGSLDDSDSYYSPTRVPTSNNSRPSSSKLSDYYGFEKDNLTQIPLYKLLKHFSIQQYARELISRGYGYDLTKLAVLDKDDLNALATEIKILPGHKFKFQKMASHVTQICFDLMRQEQTEGEAPGSNFFDKYPKKPGTAQTTSHTPRSESNLGRPVNRKPNSAVPGRRPVSGKPQTADQIRRPQIKEVSQPTKPVREQPQVVRKLQSIGLDYFTDSDHTLDEEDSNDLSAILELYAQEKQTETKKATQNPNPNPNQPQPKQKEKVTFKEPGDLMGQVDKLYSKDAKPATNQASKIQLPSRVGQQTTPTEAKTTDRPRSGILLNKTRGEAVPAKQEESSKVPEKNKKVSENVATTTKSPEQKARVLDLLEKKLDAKNLNKDDLNVELNKIKDMYSSFEGATMTATIANIDLEEMCHCFSCAIQKHIEYFIQNILPTYTPYEAKLNELREKREKESLNKQNLDTKTSMPNDIQMQNLNTKPQFNVSAANNARDDNDYFVYKGQTITSQGFQEKDNSYPEYNPSYQRPRSGENQRYERDDDEVLHSESGTVDDEEEEKYEPNSRNREGNENDEEGEGGNDPNLDDFLRQSLKDSLFMTAGEKFGTKSQQEEMQALINRFNTSKPNIKESAYTHEIRESQAELSYTTEQDSERIEDESDQIEEEEEQEEETDVADSGLAFSIEESQFIDIELNPSQLDATNRAKIVFEKTFNEPNLTLEECTKRIGNLVGKDIIANYCKNLMVTSKMEKEVVIVSLVYIERLIVMANMYLNSVNWKRICFTAFVIASKVWDDESFENQHFAKVFPQYTIKEINELERVFLDFIEYNLRVNGSEYAKYYFILRTFAEKNKKSFSLKALNVQTVRMLQKKVETTAKSLKQVYAEGLNRSFA